MWVCRVSRLCESLRLLDTFEGSFKGWLFSGLRKEFRATGCYGFEL